jgi:hypothetical protein
MKTYTVYLKTIVTTTMDVEANSLEEAIEEAESNAHHPNMQGTKYDADDEIDAYAVTDPESIEWSPNQSGNYTPS